MQMDAGLDTGDMLLRRALSITATHTAGQLHDELAALGATAIVEALQLLAQGRLTAEPQPDEGVTYAEKLQRAESVINYDWPAARIARRIRAFNPFPGSTTELPEIKGPVKVWAAEAVDALVLGRLARYRPSTAIVLIWPPPMGCCVSHSCSARVGDVSLPPNLFRVGPMPSSSLISD